MIWELIYEFMRKRIIAPTSEIEIYMRDNYRITPKQVRGGLRYLRYINLLDNTCKIEIRGREESLYKIV